MQIRAAASYTPTTSPVASRAPQFTHLTDSVMLGAGTVAAPALGALAGGFVGAVAGSAASFGLQYAATRNPLKAAALSAGPALLGCLAAAAQVSPGLAGVGVLAGAGAALGGAWAWHEAHAPVVAINHKGSRVDVESKLLPGRTNIVCFSAPWCPGCRATEPKLEEFCREHPEYVTLKVDIHDWESPVARQYGVKDIPSFRVYGPQGKMIAQGDEARAQVRTWLPE